MSRGNVEFGDIDGDGSVEFAVPGAESGDGVSLRKRDLLGQDELEEDMMGGVR